MTEGWAGTRLALPWRAQAGRRQLSSRAPPARPPARPPPQVADFAQHAQHEGAAQPPQLLLASARAALPHLRSAQPLAARPVAPLFNNWGVLCELALPEGGGALALLPLGHCVGALRRRVSKAVARGLGAREQEEATSAALLAELGQQVQVGRCCRALLPSAAAVAAPSTPAAAAP